MFRIVLIFLLFPINLYGYECNKNIDDISKKYEIKIFCSTKESNKDYISGENSKKEHLEIFYPYLIKFLNSYDKTFLQKNIKQIFLIEKLKRDGINVGGVSDGENMFICLDDFSGNLDMVYPRVLHHEFSSHIFKAANYTSQLKWKSFSKENYDFSHSFRMSCLKNYNFSSLSNEVIRKDGFVENYGRTNEENDFNTYAEILFVKPDYMKQMLKYPKINSKLEMLKRFYRNAGYTGKFPDET